MHLPLAIERRAAVNRWARCHPAPKAALALALLATASWHPSPVVSVAAGAASLWILRYVGVTWTELADSTSVPVALLLLGTLPLAVHVTPAAPPWLHLSGDGIRDAVSLIVRSMGAMLATLVLACSTPFTDLAWLLLRLRVPRPLVDTLLAMHRFLFTLRQTVVALHVAQRARLGFIGWSGHVRSTGLIAGALFGHAVDRAVHLERGLWSRGGLPLAGGPYTPAPRVLRLAIAVVILLGATTLMAGAVR